MTEPTQAAGAQQTQASGGQQDGQAQAQQAQAQQAKTFTQEQLDQIIGERLKRESAKFADYEELKKFKDEAEAKNKSELEKLTERATKAQAEAERIKSETSERLIKAEAKAAAAKLGFTKPDKAIRLADLSKAAVGEDGEVTGVEEALAALAKDMPELLKGEKPPPGSPTNPQKGAAVPGETEAQRRERLRGGASFNTWAQSGEVVYYPKGGST